MILSFLSDFNRPVPVQNSFIKFPFIVFHNLIFSEPVANDPSFNTIKQFIDDPILLDGIDIVGKANKQILNIIKIKYNIGIVYFFGQWLL